MTFPLIKFTDIVQDKSGGNKKLPQEFFLFDGQYPVVDQSKKFIAGYINDQEYLVKSTGLPVVIFGDHTKAIKFVDFPFAMGADGVKVLKPKDECDTKYLYHYLRYAKIPDAGYSRHFKFLKELEIPLPPLAEQRRITSILDQADDLRQKRQQAIEKLDQLLQATFIDMFGDPVSNPKGFLLVKLEDLVNKPITYGVLKPEEYTENGIPMLRIQDINTKKNLSHLTDFHLISNELSNQYKRTILNGHEIVISLVGTIGLVAKIPEEFKGFNIHRNLGVIDLCDKSLVDYILYFMKMPEFLILLERISKGGVHKLLNLADLRTFEFPIPPKDLQEKWSKIALGIEDQKQNLYKQLDMQNQLFSSLQNQAFNGTL